MTGEAFGVADADEPAGWPGRKAGQAAAHDRIGDRYDEAFPHKDGQLACGNWLLASLRPPAPRVLDIGCGTGLPTARQLADGGCAVTGIDISPGMLALARDNGPRCGSLSLTSWIWTDCQVPSTR